MKILKKTLKYLAIASGIFLVLLISLPLIFGGQIKQAVKDYINQQVNADVYFGDIGISVFSNFPNLKRGHRKSVAGTGPPAACLFARIVSLPAFLMHFRLHRICHPRCSRVACACPA